MAPKKELSDRVIAGRWKGRRIVLPDDADVRPTKNRVRQAVFNMLGSRIEWEGVRVLDAFCGSGAWGLEALSRGAADVVMVDVKTAVARANLAALNGRAEVVEADVRAYRTDGVFDVILADPPYGKGHAAALVRRAAELGRPGAWWVVECGVEDAVDWSGFEGVVTRVFGGTKVMVGCQL